MRSSAAHAEMAPRAAEWGLELRLGYELTPTLELLEQDLARYALEGTGLVLVELPFSGPLELVERVAEHAEECGADAAPRTPGAGRRRPLRPAPDRRTTGPAAGSSR